MKKLKLLKVATYISSGITILLGLAYIFKNIILRILLRVISGEPAAIGIIGGADGPTAIFIATKEGLSLQNLILIFGVITAILILLKRVIKNK